MRPLAIVLLSLLLLLPGLPPGRAAAREIAVTTEPVRILAFGDSLTAGWGISPPASVPSYIETALLKQAMPVTMINAGVPGDSTVAALQRFEAALACRPDMVILALGANDTLHAIDPARTEANLAAMLEALAARGIPALLAGIRPLRALGADYDRQFQAQFIRLAARYRVVFYPDYLEGVAGDPRMLQRDGLHPNRKGTKEIARRLLPLVGDMVARIRAERAAAPKP